MVPDTEGIPPSPRSSRAIFFSRVSRDGSGMPDSLADQLEELQRYCAEHDLEMVGWYADAHRGGVSGARARLAAMAAGVQRHAQEAFARLRSGLKRR